MKYAMINFPELKKDKITQIEKTHRVANKRGKKKGSDLRIKDSKGGGGE